VVADEEAWCARVYEAVEVVVKLAEKVPWGEGSICRVGAPPARIGIQRYGLKHHLAMQYMEDMEHAIDQMSTEFPGGAINVRNEGDKRLKIKRHGALVKRWKDNAHAAATHIGGAVHRSTLSLKAPGFKPQT
jgi:hypothetical protein